MQKKNRQEAMTAGTSCFSMLANFSNKPFMMTFFYLENGPGRVAAAPWASENP
jgi:hypothetical protein